MKALPIGIQSFSDLRENGYLYVDKTEDIFRLISTGKTYFLSRPRRFGKSLLLSTIEEIFKGKKELFEGLYIYDKIDWVQHPVIKIDWSKIRHTASMEMEDSMSSYLGLMAARYQISLSQKFAHERFDELIMKLYEKTGKKVVILIDEYDMPILDALNKPDTIVEIRSFLQSFYKIIKAADEHLRFVFLTGVSKFAKVSIFSGLNNPRDITVSTEYADICGYTQMELENYFAEYIADFSAKFSRTQEEALNTIKKWYNGYSWNGVTMVYNPYSILLLCTEKKISNYWFATGTPTFLINLIKNRNDVRSVLEPVTVEEIVFDSFDPENISMTPLLFQTGYLTVKKLTEEFDALPQYTLGIPNKEVNDALLIYLLNSYVNYPLGQTPVLIRQMQQQLRTGDVSELEKNIQEMFARIPYQLHIPREAYYHSLFLLWINLLGFDLIAEIPTDKGRIDAVWTYDDRVVIVEIKYADKGDCEPLLDDAISQIRKKRYYERYAGSNKRIALLAIAFAGKKIACRMEEVG